MANSEMCAEWAKCPIATQSGCKKKNCFTTTAEATENHAPSGQAEFDLLGAKDLAIASLGNLQNEFEKLNLYHYAEMMEGFGKAINGATLIAKQTKNL